MRSPGRHQSGGGDRCNVGESSRVLHGPPGPHLATTRGSKPKRARPESGKPCVCRAVTSGARRTPVQSLTDKVRARFKLTRFLSVQLSIFGNGAGSHAYNRQWFRGWIKKRVSMCASSRNFRRCLFLAFVLESATAACPSAGARTAVTQWCTCAQG